MISTLSTSHDPFGQSLGRNFNIRLDGTGGIGGVSPSVRNEMTAENALRAARGEDVELEKAIEDIGSLK